MKQVHFLIKPASSLCNLKCRYCFYEDIANHRSIKSMGIMQTETAALLIHRAFDAVERKGIIHFAFQGGEPTLAGLDFFRNFVAMAKEEQERRQTQAQLQWSIQTNGTLLNDDWAAFLKENHFLVGLSMDGCKELHNDMRVAKDGSETWNQVLNAVRLLQKASVDFNILCVVTKQCARHAAKIYSGLKKTGIEYMQFIPCLEPIGEPAGSQSYSLTSDDYGEFLCRLFDLWYRDWEQGQYHSIRLFDDHVNLLLGATNVTCSTCGLCGGYFVVEADGGIYPCDFYVLDDWLAGKVKEHSLEELTVGDTWRRLLKRAEAKPEKCGHCRWKQLCNGGCPTDRYMTEDGQIYNRLCDAFQKYFAYAEQRLLFVARQEYEARHRSRR